MFISAAAFFCCGCAFSQIVINELMQSNIDCIMDDRNDFPDSWVELYNSSDVAQDLSVYSLATESDGSNAYKLPHETIAAHGYRLVYCDKENSGWHTSFRLESGKGCEVRLLKNGVEVDAVSGLKKQPAPNIAYGRAADGGEEWGYQLQPTPGTANAGGVTDQILPEPIFSMQGQVLEKGGTTYYVSLSLPEGAPAEAQIRYTMDGSEPTLTHGVGYTEPLKLTKNTILRAKLFAEGYLSPRASTQSYIFHARKMTLPVVSIVTDPTYLYDSKCGILVEGNYQSGKKNYEFEWRRPISLELFDEPGASAALSQLCETRVQGGATRSNPLKSLALYANKRFGEKRFSYEFFPDQRPGQTNYKSLLLRNAGNDFDYLYMRDAIIQRSMSKYQDIDWQAWRPAIVYINGEYKGILNFRERSNDDNIFTNYNELEDIVMMENGWDLKAGSWNDWNRFLEFYSAHGHTWEEYEEVMDCREYIHVMIMQLFYNNRDFPGNNIVFWRPMTATESLPARWRVIAKDTDFGLGLYEVPASYKTMHWLYDNNYDYSTNWANRPDDTRMFRRAMENERFKREFLDRSAVYIGDFLRYDVIWPMWEEMYEQIREEYPIHRNLYNKWWPNYEDELQKAKNWLQARPRYFMEELASFFEQGKAVPVKINTRLDSEQASQLKLEVAGIELHHPVFDGYYYQGIPLRVSAQPVAGSSLEVKAWRVESKIGNVYYAQTEVGRECTISISDKATELVITALFELPEDLDDPSSEIQAAKIVQNGTLYLVRQGVRYTVMGERVE